MNWPCDLNLLLHLLRLRNSSTSQRHAFESFWVLCPLSNCFQSNHFFLSPCLYCRILSNSYTHSQLVTPTIECAPTHKFIKGIVCLPSVFFFSGNNFTILLLKLVNVCPNSLTIYCLTLKSVCIFDGSYSSVSPSRPNFCISQFSLCYGIVNITRAFSWLLVKVAFIWWHSVCHMSVMLPSSTRISRLGSTSEGQY